MRQRMTRQVFSYKEQKVFKVEGLTENMFYTCGYRKTQRNRKFRICPCPDLGTVSQRLREA